MLFVHWVRRAASRAVWTAGRSRATKTPIMAITTSNSTRVNPDGRWRDMIGTPENEAAKNGTPALVQRRVSADLACLLLHCSFPTPMLPNGGCEKWHRRLPVRRQRINH